MHLTNESLFVMPYTTIVMFHNIQCYEKIKRLQAKVKHRNRHCMDTHVSILKTQRDHLKNGKHERARDA